MAQVQTTGTVGTVPVRTLHHGSTPTPSETRFTDVLDRP